MPLRTFDDRNIQLTDQISQVYNYESASGNTTKTHTYTISGDGFIVLTASVRCTGSTSDYGSSYGYIEKGGYRYAHNYNRLTAANTEQQGIEVCAGIQVSDGDVVTVYLAQTKNGAKTFYYNCLCVGCTATFS